MKCTIVLASLLLSGVIHPQSINLHDTTNQYDYIIITVPGFVNECEQFSQHKETVRNIKTLVVDTSQIFAEFNTSEEPQNNIREFISYAGTYWKEPVPRFVLLAGTIDLIPAFKVIFVGTPDTAYSSDHQYRININDNDSLTTEFHVGRIPAKNAVELGNYFSKVIEYESSDIISSWMNNSLFLVHDEAVFNFWAQAQALASIMPDFMNNKFIINNPDSSYYGNKDSILNTLNEAGASVVWFQGIDEDSFFISYEYLNMNDLGMLNNNPEYFISLYKSCQSTITGNTVTLNSKMLTMPGKGSIAGIGFTGITYSGIAQLFQEYWAMRLFNNSYPSLGEAFDLELNAGFYWFMKSVSNLWGDPTLQLKFDDLTSVNLPSQTADNKNYFLSGNYPNPFNPQTTISYSVAAVSRVIIKIFDLLGNEVETLLNEERQGGTYEINWNAADLPSGIYLYRIQILPAGLHAKEIIETRKMVLLK